MVLTGLQISRNRNSVRADQYCVSYRKILYCIFGVMDYDEACFVHLTPGVVHNFPKAVGV